jgi:hypothetical protein
MVFMMRRGIGGNIPERLGVLLAKYGIQDEQNYAGAGRVLP